MKAKLVSLILGCAVLVGTTACAGSDDAPKGHNALRKLGRGFANVLFGVVEVPNQYTKANSEHGGSAGVTYGIPKGIARWIGRELVGVYEIVTFPIPFPRGYKPVMKPEFPNEDYEP
jgi:putative exosortase-associated protein (TIGR04073 family)